MEATHTMVVTVEPRRTEDGWAVENPFGDGWLSAGYTTRDGAIWHARRVLTLLAGGDCDFEDASAQAADENPHQVRV